MGHGGGHLRHVYGLKPRGWTGGEEVWRPRGGVASRRGGGVASKRRCGATWFDTSEGRHGHLGDGKARGRMESLLWVANNTIGWWRGKDWGRIGTLPSITEVVMLLLV